MDEGMRYVGTRGCATCNGRGWVETSAAVTISIPCRCSLCNGRGCSGHYQQHFAATEPENGVVG